MSSWGELPDAPCTSKLLLSADKGGRSRLVNRKSRNSYSGLSYLNLGVAGRCKASRCYFDYCDYWDYCAFCNYLHYCYCCAHWSFFQVHVDLGLNDPIWADKRAVIDKKVDDLGDQFRPGTAGLHQEERFCWCCSAWSWGWRGRIGRGRWWVIAFWSWAVLHIKYPTKWQFCTSE